MNTDQDANSIDIMQTRGIKLTIPEYYYWDLSNLTDEEVLEHFPEVVPQLFNPLNHEQTK